MNSSIKTAIKQEKKSATSYVHDGQQAYYLHRAGSQETWFTNAYNAITHWEEHGGQLFVGRSTKAMNRIRG
jgi:hypothetical protein